MLSLALVDELFFTQCTRGLLKSQIAPAWHFRALVHSGALCLIFCRDVLKGKGYFYAEKVDRDQYIGPVSYTRLDVYKRQTMLSALAAGWL